MSTETIAATAAGPEDTETEPASEGDTPHEPGYFDGAKALLTGVNFWAVMAVLTVVLFVAALAVYNSTRPEPIYLDPSTEASASLLPEGHS